MGFLTEDEVQAILSETDDSPTGRRDHLLFLLLHNTGARVSELVALSTKDAPASDRHHVLPSWQRPQRTAHSALAFEQQRLRRWIKDNQLGADSPLLPNRFG